MVGNIGVLLKLLKFPTFPKLPSFLFNSLKLLLLLSALQQKSKALQGMGETHQHYGSTNKQKRESNRLPLLYLVLGPKPC